MPDRVLETVDQSKCAAGAHELLFRSRVCSAIVPPQHTPSVATNVDDDVARSREPPPDDAGDDRSFADELARRNQAHPGLDHQQR